MEHIKNWHETVEILETLWVKLSQLSQVSHCKKIYVYCVGWYPTNRYIFLVIFNHS